MKNTDQIKIFLSMFAVSLPILIICLVAGIVILTRWRQAPSSSLYALLGFGLAMLLCFAIPLGQTLLQSWVFQSGERASRLWAFSVFSFAGSVLHAISYVFLLLAILTGRSRPDASIPPPLNRW